MLADLISLIYPQCCVICPEGLYHGEKFICTQCRYELPRTGFHKIEDNPVARHFWGRVPLTGATSFFYFNKGLKVQELIHQVKYRGKKELGIYLGQLFGHELKATHFADEVNLVIPVPLHENKQKRRGYNQSGLIAQGVAEVIGAEWAENKLIRSFATDTQTRKSRIKRWENVADKFVVVDEQFFTNKNVLLIDDVVTTGSTLEACAQAILKIPGTKVKIAALASTQ